jgi:N-acetylglucosamine-6-phosphate deacetylase
MSKGQHGNKEAKKPKQDKSSKPQSPAAGTPTVVAVAPERHKRK